MSTVLNSGGDQSSSMEPEPNLIFDVLSLEYQTLRADMMVRSSARFQFLGFVVAAGAIIGAGLGAGGDHGVNAAVWYVSAGVLVFSVLSFWMLGRDQARLSAHVARLEAEINDLVRTAPGGRLLTWESDHQRRSFFERWVLGIRP